MPIMLDDLQSSVSSAKLYSPKFFDSKLTGSGGKVGLLGAANDFINNTPVTTADVVANRKRKFTNGDTTVTMLPLSPITNYCSDFINTIHVPDMSGKTNVDSTRDKVSAFYNTKVYIDVHVNSLSLSEKQNKYQGTSKQLTVNYVPVVYIINDPGKTVMTTISSSYGGSVKTDLAMALIYSRTLNFCVFSHTNRPDLFFKEVAECLNDQDCTVDIDAIANYISSFSLYETVVQRSEEWQTSIDKVLDVLFNNIEMTYGKDICGQNQKLISSTGVAFSKQTFLYQLRYLENYNIPLDIYKKIYMSMAQHFTNDTLQTLCKHNLNLLLSNTLHNLDNNKSQLIRMPVNPNNPVDISYYSTEQKKAITSTEPLILVQSGAGSGKSTVILGRIDYMIGAGVDPNDITVLSFTNAAADNITDKNPNVHSMTIARMIHTIYSANFNHELSTIDTIVNSLDIYFKNDQVVADFKNRLIGIIKNDADAFTRMNNFVEQHYDDIIRILDTIKQTCLEMEIIICYQKIDVLTEPADITSKYLIIDEVQDNSIFEFVYTLKYVDKHKESLFIVGRL